MKITVITQEVLDKLNKRDLVGMVLSLQSRETEKYDLILQEIRKLNHRFSQFESQNIVVEQLNSFLSKRLVHMDRQCCANTQYF